MRKSLLSITAAGAMALAVIAPVARGDALGDLKSALTALPGRQPLRGSLDLVSTTQDSDDKHEGRATVRIESDEAGLSVVYPQELLLRLSEEARLEGTGKPQPATTAIREIHASDIAESVNYAPVLLRTLERSHLAEQKPSAWQGLPARQLTFNVDVPLAEKEKKHVKEMTTRLTVWIAADNLPLAAQLTVHLKARMMLISFEDQQKEEMTFAHWGDRLVVARKVSDESGSGMGQSSQNHMVETLTREAK
jgi:hypothetical protein